MNFSDYLAEVNAYYQANPEWRYGQTCFNVLHFNEPEFANEIRGTSLDPFYFDNRVNKFLEVVRDHLGE